MKLNKQQRDQKLIEACVLERWNPLAMGCKIAATAADSCVLCQVYNNRRGCKQCPIKNFTGHDYCNDSPYIGYFNASIGSFEEFDAIEEMIEFLIELLPENHPWRN